MKKFIKKHLWKILVILALLITAVSYSWYAYVADYYHANSYAKTALHDTPNVKVEYIDDDVIAFKPSTIKAGLIFYPGGKVEYTAYAPLLHALAENGFLCILPEMPCNLAVLKPGRANGLKDYFPDVKKWYMSGHSLGGAMASKYVSEHQEEFDGLILLGSYPVSDISDSTLQALVIYGTEDKVLDMNKYENHISNFPKDYSEIKIDGGNHALFGSYGSQSKDGNATITNEEQIQTTVDNIISLLQI